jgi:hypothetical protein
MICKVIIDFLDVGLKMQTRGQNLNVEMNFQIMDFMIVDMCSSNIGYFLEKLDQPN